VIGASKKKGWGGSFQEGRVQGFKEKGSIPSVPKGKGTYGHIQKKKIAPSRGTQLRFNPI